MHSDILDMMDNKFFKAYRNGNYNVLMFPDGTKIRRTEEDDFIPGFAENCDVKITDKCSQGCAFCYEGCSSSGLHAKLFDYKFLDSLHPYTELALNGNDLDHPELEDFLKILRSKKIFANLTVNQNQFMRNLDKLKTWTEEKLIWGLGVSLIVPSPDFIEEVKKFKNAVLHTIAGIITKEILEKLKDQNLKVLILGYKKLQRGISYYSEDVINKIESLKTDLPSIISSEWFKVISFDNLAISQLEVKKIVPEDEWSEFYMGDDGGFTFYIDMVKGEYSKNSVSKERYSIGELTVDQMFNNIRNHETK